MYTKIYICFVSKVLLIRTEIYRIFIHLEYDYNCKMEVEHALQNIKKQFTKKYIWFSLYIWLHKQTNRRERTSNKHLICVLEVFITSMNMYLSSMLIFLIYLFFFFSFLFPFFHFIFWERANETVIKLA